MPSPRIWQGPPGAIARSIGLDPDAPPEGEKTLEQLINAGASLDEPVGGEESAEHGLAPLLLLVNKSVLRPGRRAKQVLGGSEVGWENAVLHGPAVAMQETLVSVNAIVVEGKEELKSHRIEDKVCETIGLYTNVQGRGERREEDSKIDADG